ncbi:MAG: histidine kinase [Micrococcales bacterium]|nr:histidine kinase [Micrococcales bacterium]
MDLFTRERDRLLGQVARVYGLTFTLVSMLCLVVPGTLPSTTLLIAVVPYALLILAQWRTGASRNLVWVVLGVVAGLGAIAVITTAAPARDGGGVMAAVLSLCGASLASVALVLTSSVGRVMLLGASFALVSAVTLFLTVPLQPLIRTVGPLVMGWALTVFISIWVGAAVPQVARRIASIGRAHRAERQASETEAQRRQGARLLHDTVLATLTLLAHSGVGVSADALREQAAGDARLLRQLRLGSTPTPTASGGYNLTPVATTELGTTLESVKGRFGRMGLEVTWHGSGQLLLPSHVLDAFLLALAECLENVRRHSGVTQAHVTITEDESSVKAMITDQGVGFDIADVGEAKLGFKESVVARLKDVGGNARLFSAPGMGTTVVLEVPR